MRSFSLDLHEDLDLVEFLKDFEGLIQVIPKWTRNLFEASFGYVR